MITLTGAFQRMMGKLTSTAIQQESQDYLSRVE